MNERETIDETTKFQIPISKDVLNKCITHNEDVNEALKPYGLKLVVIHEESNTEYGPEKLLEMTKNIMLMDFRFELRKVGE